MPPFIGVVFRILIALSFRQGKGMEEEVGGYVPTDQRPTRDNVAKAKGFLSIFPLAKANGNIHKQIRV